MFTKSLAALALSCTTMGAVMLNPAFVLPAEAADNSVPACVFVYPNGNKVVYTFMELQGGDMAEMSYDLNGKVTKHPKTRLPRWSFVMNDGYATMRYKADLRYKILWSADRSEVEHINDGDFRADLAPSTMLRDGNVVARGKCGFVREQAKRDPAFADVTGE